MALSKNKESESKFVIPLIAACTLAIIIFHWVFWPEFRVLTHDTFFIVLDIAGILGFLYASWWAWKQRFGTRENLTRWIALLIAVFVCIWCGAWCSQYRQDKNTGIEYKYGGGK